MNWSEHLERVYGDLSGWTFIGSGTPVAKDGKVTQDGWSERCFRWPAQAEELSAHIADETRRFGDVFYTPGLSENPLRDSKRRKPLPVRYLWADLDTVTEAASDRAEELFAKGGLAIASGQEGHYHVYVALAEPVAPEVAGPLNLRLARFLDGDPSPSALCGYLRPVGTLNHKPAALGQGEAAPVRLHADVPGDGWTADELDRLLCSVRVAAIGGRTVTEATPEPLPDTLPVAVRRMLEDPAEGWGDRSGRHFRLVAVALEHGLTHGQVLEAVRHHLPSKAKFGRRLDAETRRAIAKLIPAEDTEGAR